MEKIKPKKLKKGDLIGIITPASSPDDLTRINKGVKYLESLGYRVEVGKNAGKYYGYLAGTDEERVEDLHYMFSNKDVKAIICARGGYGTPRLLDKLNYNLIKKNPKILVGYSDITALQMAIYRKTGLVTFAGPMLAVDFWNKVNPYTEELFWRMVTSSKKVGKICNPDGIELSSLVKGKAQGTVLGGNLALVASLMGTPYFPDLKEKILMIEDIGEAPYRVDRMLNQLKLGGVFEKISGLILGELSDCEELDKDKKTLTLKEVTDTYLSVLKVPVLTGFSHGHISNNITVGFGLNYKMNTVNPSVEVTEGAVE